MKKLWFPVLMSICVWFAGMLSADAVMIDLIPDRSTLSVGESLHVDLVISGLSGDDLSTFDLNITYDETLFSFIGYTLGTRLGDIVGGDADDWSFGDMGGGVINLAEVSWLMDLSFQRDSFSLANISFTALSAGSASVGLADGIIGPTLGDFDGDPLFLEGYPVIRLEIAEPVNAPVPLPPPVILLGTGVVGLGLFRKRNAGERNPGRKQTISSNQ